MEEKRKGYLFEVSWEVCNKVGGIYTVITSKAREAVKAYGENYYFLGPDLKNNMEFEETDEECWVKMREGTAIRDIPCRFGRWRIPGNPKAILVGFAKKYDKDQLLFRLWERYGVDSIAGGWDYVEPVMFSSACAEVIDTINNLYVKPRGVTAVAHFHAWVCGAGLLEIKQLAPEVGTVFTSHATILGRTLAASGMDIYLNMEYLSPQREAGAHNITAKCSLEAAAAREADCFTTVSSIMAAEAKNFLGREADIITPNGLDLERSPDLIANRAPALKARERLLEAASHFLRLEFSKNTRIMVISGRYEFHNKGIDIFLNALGQLEKELPTGQTVLAYLFVLGGHRDLIPSLQCTEPSLYCDYSSHETTAPPIATHRLEYEASDPILQTCSRLGLLNTRENKVHVIFMPAYLNGHDGLINMPYYEALSGCDLGVFPSYYEPWGYTPLECAAYGVPTITTDQAGFGLWAQQENPENNGVLLLSRRGQKTAVIEESLCDILHDFLNWTEVERDARRKAARSIAVQANWENFIAYYLRSYELALEVAGTRQKKLSAVDPLAEKRLVFAGTASMQPHFRTFAAVVPLPAKLDRLREFAYNVWWSWHPRALDIFATLDMKIWEESGKNPVKMLEAMPPEKLREAAENASYLALYNQALEQFDDYMAETRHAACHESAADIKCTTPVAYFSTEYGLHETIPLYSGGLGTLSGDHLKTASDLNIPLVAVGLLYKSGFFKQVIDDNGIQVAEYPENDFSTMPVQLVKDDRGKAVQISLDLPGRTLYANIWELKVGRVSLYLLSSDVPGNTQQDMRITDRLYCADRRTRIEQEILLGMGGVRLLTKLGIKPRLFHINEGHSGFLVFERIAVLMQEEKLSFEEATEVVRSSTVFTTHTPVEAGNERFSHDLMEYYFSGFVKKCGISWSQFWELGARERGEDKPFLLTILALKMSYLNNAVSRLHGHVSRRLWRDVWPGFHESDVPIGHITNGVHMMSYLSPRMREILEIFLGMDWHMHLSDKERWEKIQDIPDTLLWRTRHELKQRMVDFLVENLAQHWLQDGHTKTWRQDLLGTINPSALIIGFARRFAPYKRADLLFSDLTRLERLLSDKNRPVHIIMSGKAHPSDEMGKNLIKQVIDICREERFRGKILFIENYNLRVARHLVQGVDVWLNTPRRPYEASGTSGEKVIINGVLNLSISDGWWSEGYDGANGWNIGPVASNHLAESVHADEEDSLALLNLLEHTVIPLFYDRSATGIPEKWIALVKRSMQTLGPQFNTERMLTEYYDKMYVPAAKREQAVAADSFQVARELADWKRKVPMRFSSLKILEVAVEGLYGEEMQVGQSIIVNVRVAPGKMEREEIFVELMIGPVGGGGEFLNDPEKIHLETVAAEQDGVLKFSTAYVIKQNGAYAYGIRVVPFHRDLPYNYDSGLMIWG